jgi:hypothetical protein
MIWCVEGKTPKDEAQDRPEGWIRALPSFFGTPAYQASYFLLVTWRVCDKDSRIWDQNVFPPSNSVRTSLAASTLAGLSRFGMSDDNKEITLISYDHCHVRGIKLSQSHLSYDGFHCVHRQPSLSRIFVAILIIFGGMLWSEAGLDEHVSWKYDSLRLKRRRRHRDKLWTRSKMTFSLKLETIKRTIGMPHWRYEAHFRRQKWIFGRKAQSGFEESSFTT